jgi:hypothetical protein
MIVLISSTYVKCIKEMHVYIKRAFIGLPLWKENLPVSQKSCGIVKGSN